MYLVGYIERLGTGTADIVRKSLELGLKEPEFIQAEDFKAILCRPDTMQDTQQEPRKYLASTDELPQEFRSTSAEVQSLILLMKGEETHFNKKNRLTIWRED